MPSVGAVTSNLNVVVVKTATYTAAANDFILTDATTGAAQITLPTAPVKNTLVAVKKSDPTTATVTVAPPTGVSINGDTAGVALVSNGASVTVQYDGANWQIVATGQPNTGNSVAGLPSGGNSGQALLKSSATNYDASWGTVNGLPSGGNSGQALLKSSAANYDASWGTVSGLPSGGASGQALLKGSAADYDASWGTVSGLPSGGTAGQVLTKNSPTAGDAGWAAVAAGGGGEMHPWSSGRVSVAPPLTYGTTATNPNAQAASGQLFFPIRIPNACTIQSLSIFCAQSGFQVYTAYLGLYSEGPNAQTSVNGPATRLAYGNSLFNSAAYFPTTVTFNYTAPAAMNAWVSFACSSSPPSLVSHSGFGASNYLIGGITTFSYGASATPSSNWPTMLYSSGSGFSAQVPNASTLNTSMGISNVPIFAFTIA